MEDESHGKQPGVGGMGGPPPAYTELGATAAPSSPGPSRSSTQHSTSSSGRQAPANGRFGELGKRRHNLFPVPAPVQLEPSHGLPAQSSPEQAPPPHNWQQFPIPTESASVSAPPMGAYGAHGHPSSAHPRAAPLAASSPSMPGSFSTSPPNTGPGGYENRSRTSDANAWQDSATHAVDRGLRAMSKLNPFGSARSGESSHQQPDPQIEDVYLAVMGVTGAGKSSFVKLCTNKNVKIGHNLRSCTAFVEDFQIMYNSRVRLHLIDTPGFDDTHKSDTEVLRDIASWLGTTYSQGILLSGIIYLHRISDPRMSGGAMRNLQMFKELLGKDCYKSVMLATTFWNSIPYPKAEEHEMQLKNTVEFWGEMLSLGSLYTRHTGDKASAWRIIDVMINRRHPFLASIQHEMVDQDLDLNQTAAGRKLNADLIAMEEKHVKQMRDLENSYLEAQKEHDQISMRKIEELHEKLQKEIDDGKEAQQDLVSSLERINKERAEELANYQSSIEARMKELAEIREQLDKYQDGSREAQRQNDIYKEQLESLRENLESVQRRTPGFVEWFSEWFDEKMNKLGNWLDRVLE